MKNKIQARHELDNAHRDYNHALYDLQWDFSREVKSIREKYARWPMTRQGEAIRNYIARYKAQHNDS